MNRFTASGGIAGGEQLTDGAALLLILGRRRFKDFIESPESIPTNILRDGGLVEHIPAADGSKRHAYQLTDKGLALRPVLRAIRDWGLKWEPGTKAPMEAAWRSLGAEIIRAENGQSYRPPHGLYS